jgi:signal transduction histidine kinase
MIDTPEELRASRARVVAAADAERRRIERELHDGAQQHLVALVVNLQLARRMLDSDPAGARELLEELGRDTREALDDVRELAYRIYPALLLDRGLAEALHAAASRAGVPTKVDVAPLGRYAPEVEEAVYFCCVDALQRADPRGRATLRAWHDPGALRFEIAADFTEDLTDLGDRLGALDGELTVSPTHVAGTIPI